MLQSLALSNCSSHWKMNPPIWWHLKEDVGRPQPLRQPLETSEVGGACVFPWLGREVSLYQFTTHSIKSQLLSRPLKASALPPCSASRLPCLRLHPQTGMRQIPACCSGRLLPPSPWLAGLTPLSFSRRCVWTCLSFLLFMCMCMVVCPCV